jgi:type II secretory pathway pseudopilin PulG
MTKLQQVHTEHVAVPVHVPVPVVHHEHHSPNHHHGHEHGMMDHAAAATETQRRKGFDFPVFVRAESSIMPQQIVQAMQAVNNFLSNNPISQAFSNAANTAAASMTTPVVTPVSSVPETPKPEERQSESGVQQFHQSLPLPMPYQALFPQNLQAQQLQQQIHQQEQQQQLIIRQQQQQQTQSSDPPQGTPDPMTMRTGFVVPTHQGIPQSIQQPVMQQQQPQANEQTVLAPIYTPETEPLQGSLKEVLEIAAAANQEDAMWSQLTDIGSILKKKKKK